MNEKLKNWLFGIYILWFLVSSFILLFVGLAEQNISVIGQGSGYLIEGLVVFLVWIFRKKIGLLISKISIPIVLKFVLIGWFFAMIAETIFWPTNPLFSGVSYVGDLILTTPSYLLGYLFWSFVILRYRLSIKEAYFIGGLSLLIIESFGFGAALFDLATYALFAPLIMMHGMHMVMPSMIMQEDIEKRERKMGWIKYLLGILLPFIGVTSGILFIYIGKYLGIR